MAKIIQFAAALGFVIATAGIAPAMPAAAPCDGLSMATQAAFGCPRGMHPGRFGRCERNGPDVMVRPAPEFRPAPMVRRSVCPPGMRLSNSGRHCVTRF